MFVLYRKDFGFKYSTTTQKQLQTKSHYSDQNEQFQV